MMMDKALKQKADDVFAGMAKDMHDIGEGEMGLPRESSMYYPTIEIPMSEMMECKPGEELKLVAIGTVDSINTESIRVKIKKVGMMHAEEDKEEEGEY